MQFLSSNKSAKKRLAEKRLAEDGQLKTGLCPEWLPR
jgi:hypothetical protein